MSLDIKTIIFLTAISALVMSVTMFVTAANYPQIKGIRRWAIACGLQGVGWGLLGMRGELHEVFSVFAANILIVSSAAIFYLAIASFKELDSHNFAFSGFLLVFLLIFTFFTFYQPNFAARSMITAGTSALITFFCSFILIFASNGRPTKSEWVMGLSFLAISITAFVRLCSFAFHISEQSSELFNPDIFNGIVFGLFFLSILILTFSFSLMINDKFMEEIMRLATLDSLTETYNRAAMETLSVKEIERAKRYKFPLSFLLLDLDHFKRVNDNYGHQVGDLTLKKVVEITTNELRQHDILGRFGGEEFTVLLPDTDLISAKIVAERIRNTVKQTKFYAGEKPFRITVSIGLATFNHETDDFQELFRRADLGLYKAKQTGRNQVVAVHDDNRTEAELDEVEIDIFKSNPSINIPQSIKP
jgi:diguanylate cyclase (GGDEF)-like protein